MKYLMTAAALFLGMMTAQAQTGTDKPTAPATHNCLTSTTDKDWKSLDITPEQTAKLKELQSESMKTSTKMKTDNMETKTSPMMDKYENKVKEVLTPAQYEKWVKECSTRASIDTKTIENEEPADDNN